ncbi:MATE family multidrug resistance protein [Candidatus Kinetoplastibacterium oncopeltii TCC290E]|uniref:Multidrug-efflux transporter n=1 Tax=Candidatus Kinetoplastidibacterium stringomonadis TCC290E TaxID=1208920 RepID=M1LS83_9PROT|nr:MATE family efflux transporter [Candidatus Kinetoplastibacterium oncopeltii]AGF48407.1 MATE family multidrug resistance protein [Candidatus Kinetoplastibacterium oncopeltii TCC290E]
MSKLSNLEIFKKLTRQSFPILVSQLAGISFGLLDTIMTGHTNKNDLAAVSLATSIYVIIFVGLLGVINALVPIIAKSFGSGNNTEIGEYWGQGFWVSIVLSIVGTIPLFFSEIWFYFIGDINIDVYNKVVVYLKILIIALPAALIFRTIYNLCAALSKSKVMIIVSMVSVICKASLNYILIYGCLKIPPMGSTGASVSTTIVSWISLFIGILIIYTDNFYKQFNIRIRKPDILKIKEILKLGLPMGGSYLVEVLTFSFMTILITREGIVAVGAHQIITNIVSVFYIIPISLGLATSSMTAQFLGAKNNDVAIQIGKIGIKITMLIAMISCIAIYYFSNKLPVLYTNDLSISVTCSNMMFIVPFFLIVDSVQCFNSYILRAYNITALPFILQTVSLGVVGLGGGWWFDFGPGVQTYKPIHEILFSGAPIGASSMWIMSTSGLAISAFSLYVLYKEKVIKKLLL